MLAVTKYIKYTILTTLLSASGQNLIAVDEIISTDYHPYKGEKQ